MLEIHCVKGCDLRPRGGRLTPVGDVLVLPGTVGEAVDRLRSKGGGAGLIPAQAVAAEATVHPQHVHDGIGLDLGLYEALAGVPHQKGGCDAAMRVLETSCRNAPMNDAVSGIANVWTAPQPGPQASCVGLNGSGLHCPGPVPGV